MHDQLTLGIVGAGSFALFAARAFTKLPGIRIKGVSDINEAQGNIFAKEIGAAFVRTYDLLLDDEEIDLIYVASPPSLHASQSAQALRSGKHVICEKPAALSAHEAEECAAIARSSNLLYTVNLMQRYNPLYQAVQLLINEKWLGDFLHGFFENYASDEKLTPDHWFWDASKSGGIFIEHGVHFFDMFQGWFGKGDLIHALELTRGSIVDCVQATVLYDNSPVNFYHGFNQPKVLDRQELRLQFDRGDITLYEWIPVKIRIHGLFTSAQMDQLMQIFPDAIVETSDEYSTPGKVRGKFREIKYDVLATITSGDISDKMERYEQLVMSMITDQWAWIRDPSHKRIIDETNAVDSLRIAEEASKKAARY